MRTLIRQCKTPDDKSRLSLWQFQKPNRIFWRVTLITDDKIIGYADFDDKYKALDKYYDLADDGRKYNNLDLISCRGEAIK